MTLSLTTAAPDLGGLDTPLLVVALAAAPTLTADLGAVDAATSGALARALSRRDFRGGRDETLHLSGGERGPQRVLLIGMGPAADRVASLRRAGAIAGRQGNRLGVGRLAFYAGELTAAEPRPDVAVRLKGACTPLQLALASGPLFRRTLCRRRVGARPNRSPKWQYSRRGKLLPARRTLFQNYVVEQSEIVVSVVEFALCGEPLGFGHQHLLKHEHLRDV